jgi:hypothetical protein
MHRRQLKKGRGTSFAGAIFAIGVAGCGASADGLARERCPIATDNCVAPNPDAGGDNQAPPPGDSAPGDAAASRSPLCGVIGCFPGNPSACGPTPEGDSATWARVDVDATYDDAQVEHTPSHPDGSDDSGRSDASSGSDGAAPPAADASIQPSDAQNDVGAGDEPRPPRSCYVRPSDSLPGTRVVTECAPVGQGAVGSDCQDSSDCGAELACVDVKGKPTCRRFSCALPTSCMKGSFYQLQALRVSGVTMADVKVPVCLPTDNCDLMADASACPSGQVCAVVGSDGDTTCVVEGTAKLGGPCDDLNFCARGLVCSKSKNQCLKICRTSAAGATECPGGTCQGGNLSVPEGFGICVGTTPDGG